MTVQGEGREESKEAGENKLIKNNQSRKESKHKYREKRERRVYEERLNRKGGSREGGR